MSWITVDGKKLDVYPPNRDDNNRVMKAKLYCDGWIAEFIRVKEEPMLVSKMLETSTRHEGRFSIPDPTFKVMLKVVYGMMFPRKKKAKRVSVNQLTLNFKEVQI